MQVYSQQVKVLFIGNSFVASNDLPGIFRDMAQAAGYNVTVMGHAPGGIFVGDTRQGNMAHANNPQTYDLIRQDQWDYIVVQDNQGFYSWDYGWFPPVADEVNSHKKIRDSAVANNPCARMVLFSGWCFKNGWQGSPPIFATGSDMNQRVFENYCYLNKSLNEIVTPISISWNRIIKDLPKLDLWSPDQAHPSYEGSYLAAATIFASIFKTSPEMAMFKGQLDSADARHMRKTAYQVVVDSLVPTNLNKHTLSLAYANKQLKADAGYSNYEWYRNDTLLRITQKDTLKIDTVAACYRVVATDNKGCIMKSVATCVKPTTTPPPRTGISNMAGDEHIAVYPNPAANSFVVATAAKGGIQVQLYNIAGAMVYSRDFRENNTHSYKNELPVIADGLYILKVHTENGTSTTKLEIHK